MSPENKLRPYYDSETFDAGYPVIFKPGVGLIDTDSNKPINTSLASSIASKANGSKGFRGGGLGLKGLSNKRTLGDIGIGKSSSSSGTDKNFLYDLEFQEYFDVNNMTEVLRNLVWNFVKNYCKTLFSQPLEIVRLVLQVGLFETKATGRGGGDRKQSYSRLLLEARSVEETGVVTLTEESGTDSDSEISYFKSTDASASPEKAEAKPKHNHPHKKKRTKDGKRKNLNKIRPFSKHTLDIMSAIAARDGPFALFKGINASFIYQTLSHTIEAWITGFLSPFLGIPDPFFLGLTHLTEPLKSLCLSVLACVLTGLILMPLDLIKVKLMITLFNKPFDSELEEISLSTVSLSEDSTPNSDCPGIESTRSVRESIRNYPFHYIIQPPATIAILTFFYNLSTSLFRKGAPYILFIKFNVDSFLSPTVFTTVNLFLLILELFIKLPVENLLRKEQIKFLIKPKTQREDPKRIVTIDDPDRDVIVEINYSCATNSHIYDSESDSDSDEYLDTRLSLLQRFKQLGLFNGWRVGVLNVIGFWGYNILKKTGSDFKEERF